MPIVNPSQINSVSMGVEGSNRDNLIRLMASALSLVADLVPEETGARAVVAHVSARSLALAASAAVQSVNALMAAAAVKCNIVTPPEDIDMKMTGSGRLVYRCYHSPDHEWDLSGNRLR